MPSQAKKDIELLEYLNEDGIGFFKPINDLLLNIFGEVDYRNFLQSQSKTRIWYFLEKLKEHGFIDYLFFGGVVKACILHAGITYLKTNKLEKNYIPKNDTPWKKIYDKVGFWGSLATIISLFLAIWLAFLSPKNDLADIKSRNQETEKVDSQKHYTTSSDTLNSLKRTPSDSSKVPTNIVLKKYSNDYLKNLFHRIQQLTPFEQNQIKNSYNDVRVAIDVRFSNLTETFSKRFFATGWLICEKSILIRWHVDINKYPLFKTIVKDVPLRVVGTISGVDDIGFSLDVEYIEEI